MTDVFLRPGAANPKDVVLRDPTHAGAATSGTADSGQGSLTNDAAALLIFTGAGATGQGSQSGACAAQLIFTGTDASGQGSQVIDAAALLQFIASASSAQGGQTVDAAALLRFVGSTACGQASQSVDAAALLQFIAQATSAQGSQSVQVVALEQFVAATSSGQGAQTVDSTDAEVFLGAAASAQGMQAAGAAGEVRSPAESGSFVPRGVAVRINRKRLSALPIAGTANTGSHGGGMEAVGAHLPVPAVQGGAASVQPLAEVIAIGSVDNRRPRNSRKQRIAAALLLAA